MGVREVVGRGVGVHEPDDPPGGGDDGVRVSVHAEEGRDLLHPLGDLPVVEDPALGGEVVGQEHLDLGEAGREGEAAPQGADGHPAGARVRRVHVLVALGVVELRRAHLDEHVRVRDLAVVDLRPRDLERAGDGGRDVLDEELRQPLAGHAIDRPHDRAVPVRVHEVLVDPDAARQVGVRQLADGQHHLPGLSVQLVPVVVHVHELVVRADLLELAVGIQRGAVLPEADVLDGGVVRAQDRGAEVLLGRERARLDPVEPVGPVGGRDRPLDVGALGHDLVGRHAKPLDDGGVRGQAEEPPSQPEPDPDQGEEEAGPRHLEEEQDGPEAGQADHDVERRERGVDVRVARPERRAASGEQEAEGVQRVPPRLDDEERGSEREEVPLRPRVRDQAGGRQPDPARQHVDGGDGGQGHREDQRQELKDADEKRVREDVEPDVAAEQGLGHAEGPRVPVPDHRLPERRPVAAQHERDHEAGGQTESPVERLDQGPAGQLRQGLLAVEIDEGRPEPPAGRQHVGVQHQERHRARHQTQQRLRRQDGPEDPGKADLVEPQPVGVELHCLPAERQHHEQDGHHGDHA